MREQIDLKKKKKFFFSKKIIFKKKKKFFSFLLTFLHRQTHTLVRALRTTTTTTHKNKSANKMSSSDEEEEREESEEEEEENSDDSDSEYRHSQDDDENFVREQNVKALRDGLPLSKIRYASVLSNLKPPEPDEVILKRHFAPLVPGGALQTGTFLLCSLVCFLARSEEESRFWIFERFFFVRRPKRRVFWVPTFEKKSTSSLSLSVSSLFVVIAFTLHFSSDDSISKTFSFSVIQLGYKERFSLGKYSSRSDRSSKSSCRELSRPTRTRKISCSQKASKSWCCGKTRIRKEKRRRVRYLR